MARKDWATAPVSPDHHIAYKPEGVFPEDDAHVKSVMEGSCRSGKCGKNSRRPDMSMGLWTHRFQLRPSEDHSYAVYVSDQKQGGGNTLKINREKMGDKSWFIYDHRTKSLRLEKNRDLALSNHYTSGGDMLKEGKNAIFRKFKNEVDQAVEF